jgi:hypothetical protein
MGDSNRDQLVKIAQVLGTDNLYKYLKKYHLKLDEEFLKLLGKYVPAYPGSPPNRGPSSSSPTTRPSVPRTPSTSSAGCSSTTTPNASSPARLWNTATLILSALDTSCLVCLHTLKMRGLREFGCLLEEGSVRIAEIRWL